MPDQLSQAERERLERWAHGAAPGSIYGQIGSLLATLDAAEKERDALRERVAYIRPWTDAERAALYREHDVVDEARRLSNAPSVINTTAALDRALKRYDEAVALSRLGAGGEEG